MLSLGLVAPIVPAATPVEMPVPRAVGKGVTGKAAPSATPAAAAAKPGAAPAEAPAPAVPDDPMERLRLRLAERLATPGAAPVSGTMDLQVGTRVPAAAAKPGAAVHGTGPGAGQGAARAATHPATHAATHAAPASVRVPGAPGAGAPSAHDIGRGHAEGIAWSRPPVQAPVHRVAASPSAAPAMHAAPAAGHAPTGSARRPVAGKNAGHGGQPHWSYEGAGGPAEWGALRPDFGLCANGQRQSPIDIRGGLPVDLDPVKFDYRPSPFSVVDNGHTVQVNLPPGNAIELGGRRFELVQFHFHRPSEERIDGRQFDMSLHLVHKDPTGRLAVVGVLMGRGPAHPAVQTVWNNLPLERHEEVPARAQIDPAHLLPEDRRYYTYMGSLTTPPCSEGVHWVVMRTPVTMTPEQIELFARIYPMNARPVQSVAGRRILQSQ